MEDLIYKSLQGFQETKEEYKFEGFASTYDNPDLVNDVMVKGCFDERLAKSDKVKLRLDHKYDFQNLLGIAKLIDSSEGLVLQKAFDKENHLEMQVYKRLKDGSLDSLSVGFKRPKADEYEEKTVNNAKFRYIKKADLVEVSLVDMPCNPKAKITMVKNYSTIREAEECLRDLGLSNSESKKLISVIKGLPLSDSSEIQIKNTIENLFTKYKEVLI